VQDGYTTHADTHTYTYTYRGGNARNWHGNHGNANRKCYGPVPTYSGLFLNSAAKKVMAK